MDHSSKVKRNYSCVVYRRHEFIIIKSHDGYIVYNTNKGFNNGHTHLNNFNTCISIIKLVERREMPINHSDHFLDSILRINQDKEYAIKIKELMVDNNS